MHLDDADMDAIHELFDALSRVPTLPSAGTGPGVFRDDALIRELGERTDSPLQNFSRVRKGRYTATCPDCSRALLVLWQDSPDRYVVRCVSCQQAPVSFGAWLMRQDWQMFGRWLSEVSATS